MNIPIGVARLLAVAALENGVSYDEYVVARLTEHACEIANAERLAELRVMQVEPIVKYAHAADGKFVRCWEAV